MSTMSNEEVSPAAVPSPATPAGPPPEGPWLKNMREILGLLAHPIDERMGKLELHLAGFTADDVAKDILQLQRRLLWQPADLWCLLANERAAIGDAKGADKCRREGRVLMDHWGEEPSESADVPLDARERLNRLQATRTRPLNVEEVVNSFGDVSAEPDEGLRDILHEYGRAFGEHVRPVIEKLAAASVRAAAGEIVVAGQLLNEAHRLMDVVSMQVAYPVAGMWCDLGYVCKALGDLKRASAFSEDAYLLLSVKHFRLRADEAVYELLDAQKDDADPDNGEEDEDGAEATQKRIDELRGE